MKQQFVILFLLACYWFSCKSGGNVDKIDGNLSTQLVQINAGKAATFAQIQFEDTLLDFGKITAGEKVTCFYAFKNSGTSDLLITDAHGSCGCTTPIYPHEPIAPGKTGKVEVTFDSDGKSGFVTKTVTVTSNTSPSVHYLKFTAQIDLNKSE